MKLCSGNLKFGEMEFGEMKRNTSDWSNFASFCVARVCQRQLGFLVCTDTDETQQNRKLTRLFVCIIAAQLHLGLSSIVTVIFLSVQCNTLHGTEYKITCGVFLFSACWCIRARAHGYWGPNISKTVRDRGSVPMVHQ